MSQKREGYYKGLFLAIALYDFVIGGTLLFFYKPVFRSLHIVFPVNPSYLSLSTAFVIVIGFAAYLVYRNIHENRELAIVSTAFKLVYVAVAIYYLFLKMVPHGIFVAFGIIDTVFLVLMIEFLKRTKDS
jgi:uncharacterized membrane protein (UPF0136 family)